MNEVFDLIAVRPPYFALQNICLDPGSLMANAAPSHPLRREQSVIAAAEAGRHLAIAGAIAAATLHELPGKHFYLARRASIRKSSRSGTALRPGETLNIRARSEGVTKRKASATATISHLTEGKERELYTICVDYDVLSPRIFQRLIGGMQALPEPASHIEILEQDIPMRRTSRETVEAEVPVLPGHCVGHFPDYPALPVAKVMHLLSNLAGEHLSALLGASDLKFEVRGAEVMAERLAPAGSHVRILSTYLGPGSDDAHKFRCEARIPEGICGTMDLTLVHVHPT